MVEHGGKAVHAQAAIFLGFKPKPSEDDAAQESAQRDRSFFKTNFTRNQSDHF